MGRSILAILVGFILVPLIGFSVEAASVRFFPESFPGGRLASTPLGVIILLGNTLGVFVGCYVTAAIQRTRPMRHALILGALGMPFAIYANLVGWDLTPMWYHIVAIGQVMPLAWLAGKVYLGRHPVA